MATVSTSQGEENLTVHGPTSVGWDATVPPNEAVNHLGEFRSLPHRTAFVPTCRRR